MLRQASVAPRPSNMSTSPSSAIRVLLVEDHGFVRAGIASLFASSGDFELVAAVGSGAAAIPAIEQHAPDVVLLDLNLPDVPGLEILRRLRSAGSAAKVVVVTSHDSADVIRQALALGARGYVFKRSGVAPLFEALRTVAAGKTYLSPEAEAQVAAHANDEPLSAREIQILRLAAQGLSNAEIGRRCSISERTVKFHVGSILQKLDAADRAHAVAIALRRGVLDV